MELIKVKHGQISKLAKDFKVSMPTVRAALRGQAGPNAKLLRKAALERGGKLLTDTPKDSVKCNHTSDFSSDKIWTQTFCDRVKIISDLNTGNTRITLDGETLTEFENTTMRQLPAIQAEAQIISEGLKQI